jgi:DNA polymerase III gamma/tau subunit
MRLNLDMISDRLERILQIEKIKYEKSSLKEIANISGGDMRYAINLLQLVSDRFKNVNNKNITIMCDNPNQDILLNVFDFVKNNKIKEALQEIIKLKDYGFSVYDIFTAMFNLLKLTDKIDEAYKMNILYVLSSYLFNISKYTDSEINLVAFILELGKNIKN